MSSALFRAVHRGSLSRYTPHSTARRALAHRCFSAQTESNNRRGKGTEMPSPDKGTVIQRLQDLLRQAQNFDKLDPDFYRSADFENWKSEVDRWLRAGSPYTDDQSADFLSVRFVEIGWYSDRPQVEFWRNALKGHNTFSIKLSKIFNRTGRSQMEVRGLLRTLRPGAPPSST